VNNQIRINRAIGEAIADYGLIQNGDRILVAVSGGKDSLTLLHFLGAFRKKAPVSFELLAVHLDQGDGIPTDPMSALFTEWGIPFEIIHEDIRSIVREKVEPGGIQCPVCSRLRRGILYRCARERGYNKVALGHHRDDLLQTFMLNALFAGKLGTMPPIYRIEAGDLMVIRPLVYVHEEWIVKFIKMAGWPLFACSSCGSSDVLRRAEMGRLLVDLEARFPGAKNSLFGAIGNPHRNELLDRTLWSHPDHALPR
jgi:tRNA 2-thiocytidine biosynthesis protein TtcA